MFTTRHTTIHSAVAFCLIDGTNVSLRPETELAVDMTRRQLFAPGEGAPVQLSVVRAMRPSNTAEWG